MRVETPVLDSRKAIVVPKWGSDAITMIAPVEGSNIWTTDAFI